MDKKEKHRIWYQQNKERLRPKKAELMRKYRKAHPNRCKDQWKRCKKKRRERMFDLCKYRILCMNSQFIERIENGKQNQYPQVVRRILEVAELV